MNSADLIFSLRCKTDPIKTHNVSLMVSLMDAMLQIMDMQLIRESIINNSCGVGVVMVLCLTLTRYNDTYIK